METLTLYQLNGLLKEALTTCFPDRYWIRAELSEVRESSTGHCYLELVEKSEKLSQPVARAKGVIWAENYKLLRRYFESQTGITFEAGLQVCLKVGVAFHELYGYSLVISEIDPSYTVGDMVRRRRELLLQLEAAGLVAKNKSLPFPMLPQRIAVISSGTAAGYGDFMQQLHANNAGIRFYSTLYPAIMQGGASESSLLEALHGVEADADCYDLLVIIRGGGATSDLSCFDSYAVAVAIAEAPLPVVIGIGHDRDQTLLDQVAARSVKTPTAAAQLILDVAEAAYGKWLQLQQQLTRLAREQIALRKSSLETITTQFAPLVQGRLWRENDRLMDRKRQLEVGAKRCMHEQITRFAHLQEQLRLLSPDAVLARGYTLTACNGRVASQSSELRKGDQLITYFRDGKTCSTVTDIDLKK